MSSQKIIKVLCRQENQNARNLIKITLKYRKRTQALAKTATCQHRFIQGFIHRQGWKSLHCHDLLLNGRHAQ
jgi:hypothetical protein